MEKTITQIVKTREAVIQKRRSNKSKNDTTPNSKVLSYQLGADS